MQKTAPEIPVVLIVEDHDTLRAALRDWIEHIVPGASVFSAASVQEALDTLERAAADVVLMDIGLPGMNGIEGTRLIRARAPQTAVVMLSIMDDRAHIANALDAGAVAFIPKRRMRNELPPVLRAVLEKRSSRASLADPGAGRRP